MSLENHKFVSNIFFFFFWFQSTHTYIASFPSLSQFSIIFHPIRSVLLIKKNRLCFYWPCSCSKQENKKQHSRIIYFLLGREEKKKLDTFLTSSHTFHTHTHIHTHNYIMDTLQPLEEIDLSFPAQPSSSSTFIHSHNNVMASSHNSTDAPNEEEEGIKTEPQEEAPQLQRFVAVVIPAKHPSLSSNNNNTMRVKAELAETGVKKEEQEVENDEYMKSEGEEASLASSSRPGFHAAASATDTIVKPYNARGDDSFSFLHFCFNQPISQCHQSN